MTLGTSRPRNWGKESQKIALSMLLTKRRVAYKIKAKNQPHLIKADLHRELFLAPSHNGITLPFNESFAILTNPQRGV